MKYQFKNENQKLAKNLLKSVLKSKKTNIKNYLSIKFMIKLINLVYEERLALIKSKCIMNLREFDFLTFFYTIMLSIYDNRDFAD